MKLHRISEEVFFVTILFVGTYANLEFMKGLAHADCFFLKIIGRIKIGKSIINGKLRV